MPGTVWVAVTAISTCITNCVMLHNAFQSACLIHTPIYTL